MSVNFGTFMKEGNLETYNLPKPSERRIALRINLAAERALRSGHPWLFENAIVEQSHEGAAGDLAIVFDSKRRFLAVGLFDPHASIRVRILQHRKQTTINRAWFIEKLSAAAQRRASLIARPPATATTGYRLVHGENDGFPGLVLDLYNQSAVLKLYTTAWIPHLEDVLYALHNFAPIKRVILRLSRAMIKHQQVLHGLQDGMILVGAPINHPILFRENGLVFETDPIRGQKTGFFLDQRDNRARVEKLADEKIVLNVFAYTGGFSVYAARGGAKHIISLDLSSQALETANHNMTHNQDHPVVAAAKHDILVSDAFAALKQMKKEGRRFDMVIVDPPMFAKKQAQVPNAMQAYRRLTQLSLSVLRPGGILVQASCSNPIEANYFFKSVHQSALQIGRPLSEIERTGHALDHPITFKEGAYLKCIFAVAP